MIVCEGHRVGVSNITQEDLKHAIFSVYQHIIHLHIRNLNGNQLEVILKRFHEPTL